MTAADNFSITRTLSLFGFYSSTLKRQLLTYVIVSILLSLLLLLPVADVIRTGFFSMTWMIIQWLWYLSPISLTKRGYSNGIETLLPLKASEKFAFFILYFLIIIPVCLYTLPVCAELYILKGDPELVTVFTNLVYFQLHAGWIIRCINLFSALLSVSVCLYYVLKSKHNKVLYGIVSAFVCQIVLGVLGAIVGGYEEMASGFKDGWNGVEVNPGIVREVPESAEESIRIVNQLLQPSEATIGVIIIIIIAIIVYLTLIYKRLRRPAM